MDKVHELLKQAFNEAKSQGVILKGVDFVVSRYTGGFYLVNVDVTYEGVIRAESNDKEL